MRRAPELNYTESNYTELSYIELSRLARLCGINRSYRDIWGTQHRISDNSLRRALSDLGFAAETAPEIESSIHAIRESYLTRVLEPVRVVIADERPVFVFVNLNSSQLAEPLTWRLTFENGEELSGKLWPSKLVPIARRETSDRQALRFRLGLGTGLPLGYHSFELLLTDGAETTVFARQSLIVTPQSSLPGASPTGADAPETLVTAAFSAEASKPERSWGLSCQLYALRSQQTWGIGDFQALAELTKLAASAGAAFVGISPLHALSLTWPENRSPYSPSSRLLLNPLFISIDWAVEGYQLANSFALHELRDRAALLEEREQIDYQSVATLKLAALRLVFVEVAKRLETDLSYQRFIQQRAEVLAHYAALEEGRTGFPPGFLNFLQWEAHRQLLSVTKLAEQQGLRRGLYLDLALGVDGGGVDARMNSDSLALGMSMGCPPDEFNLQGQQWGLPPFISWKLREQGYRPFIETLRSNMAYAGQVRLDHVMSLFRVYCIPSQTSGTEGVYLRYRFDELLGIVALEAERNGVTVIGEDLGTVPAIVPQQMSARDVLSYKVFWFMRDSEGEFLPAEAYPEKALVTLSTHDLPTLRGFWRGIDWGSKSRLRLFPNSVAEQQGRELRQSERRRLRKMLPQADDSSGEFEQQLFAALTEYLASTPSQLLAVQLEDLMQMSEQMNLPGTVSEYPNWMQRYPQQTTALPELPTWAALVGALERSGRN